MELRKELLTLLETEERLRLELVKIQAQIELLQRLLASNGETISDKVVVASQADIPPINEAVEKAVKQIGRSFTKLDLAAKIREMYVGFEFNPRSLEATISKLIASRDLALERPAQGQRPAIYSPRRSDKQILSVANNQTEEST